MASSVEPDQTVLSGLYTVYPGLSIWIVPIFRVIATNMFEFSQNERFGV